MITPCEVAVRSVIPAMKALMARKLVEKHGLKQEQAAEILGISQSAVSKYTRGVRGYVIRIGDIEQVEPLMDKMIRLLVDGHCQRRELMAVFCQTCLTIRKTNLMCQFCQRTEPTIQVEECNFCST